MNLKIFLKTKILTADTIILHVFHLKNKIRTLEIACNELGIGFNVYGFEFYVRTHNDISVIHR